MIRNAFTIKYTEQIVKPEVGSTVAIFFFVVSREVFFVPASELTQSGVKGPGRRL